MVVKSLRWLLYFVFEEFGQEWTNTPCKKDGVRKRNTPSSYYCPIVSHNGWLASTNQPQIIYLRGSHQVPSLITDLQRNPTWDGGTMPIKRWSKRWCDLKFWITHKMRLQSVLDGLSSPITLAEMVPNERQFQVWSFICLPRIRARVN